MYDAGAEGAWSPPPKPICLASAEAPFQYAMVKVVVKITLLAFHEGMTGQVQLRHHVS